MMSETSFWAFMPCMAFMSSSVSRVIWTPSLRVFDVTVALRNSKPASGIVEPTAQFSASEVSAPSPIILPLWRMMFM